MPPASWKMMEPEESGCGGIANEVRQRRDVDAGSGDVSADPVNDEGEQREEELALQLLVDG